MADRKQEERLIRVRKNDLLGILGAPRKSGENGRPGLDHLDLPLAFPDIGYPYAIADGHQIRPATLPAN